MNYGQYGRLEDRLGADEPPYRSRGEAQVGRLLDRNGIPFTHEQPLVVYDRGRYRIWHPDFVLPSYDGAVIEYAGMPDRPAYLRGVRHKARVYAANGVPAMFVFPQDLQGPDWPARLMTRVNRDFSRNYVRRAAGGNRHSYGRATRP